MTPLRIVFGGYQNPASIHNRAATRFGELLTQRLGDRVEFELIGNVLDLGRKSGDLPLMVESGELTGCYISTVRFSKAVPELRLLELPFLVHDRQAVYRALDGELGRLCTQRMHANTPYRLLGYWDNGFRHFTNRVRPIRRPEDCRGIRIRTQMSELHGEVFRALGFVPVPADIKLFVEEIAGDMFEAQDNPLTNIYNFGVHHHHRYITLSGHFFGASGMVCNAALYASWPSDVQTAVDEAAREATAYQHQLATAEDAEILAKLNPQENEIVRLTPEEHAAFVAAVRPVTERYRRELDPALFRMLER